MQHGLYFPRSLKESVILGPELSLVGKFLKYPPLPPRYTLSRSDLGKKVEIIRLKVMSMDVSTHQASFVRLRALTSNAPNCLNNVQNNRIFFGNFDVLYKA